VVVNSANRTGRTAFPRRNNEQLKTQWLCDPPQLAYRCGGSTGIAYPVMNNAHRFPVSSAWRMPYEHLKLEALIKTLNRLVAQVFSHAFHLKQNINTAQTLTTISFTIISRMLKIGQSRVMVRSQTP
jgi:hypothetical protein